MKKVLAVVVSVVIVSMFSGIACSKEKQEKQGEELFKMNCAVCHPDGQNVINKDKTLHKKDLDKNGVKTPDDIVKLMRNPGPGMKTFDKDTISDKDAKEIANYILKTFK